MQLFVMKETKALSKTEIFVVLNVDVILDERAFDASLRVNDDACLKVNVLTLVMVRVLLIF